MMMARSHPSACVQIYTFPGGCLQAQTEANGRTREKQRAFIEEGTEARLPGRALRPIQGT